MLTLNAAGKSANEAVRLIQDALNGDDEEIKILIDSPVLWPEINKFLISQGFNDIVPEDDDGALYIMVSKNAQKDKEEVHEEAHETESSSSFTSANSKNATAILISGENRKYRYDFLRKFLLSLMDSRIKPDIIALMNDSVKLAAYDSETCDYLKKLNAEGVNVLVSESCADRLKLTEAIGTGELEDMSEIIERVLECEKVISI
ncbi:MAG: hypothetical protein IJG34_10610 [Synergistaceae bacterium]|nr:hypothetical protein [Synergistaceae bacterium]MBQ3450333.1 hypothetical protein [Synergistaceae bacterium]